MPNLSANLTFLFPDLPFLDRFAAAAAAGFDTVEFMSPYDDGHETIGNLLRRHGLRLDLFNLPAGDMAAGERGTAVLPHRTDEFRTGVETALTYAAALGTRKLNCLVGNRDESLSWDLQYQCLIDNLRWAIARLTAVDLTLNVEPLCSAEAPGFFLDSIALAERVLRDVGSDALRIQFDVYHVQRGEGDVVATLRRVFDRVGHVQIADSPARGEPGSGELNFNFILAELDRLGYGGQVALEYRPTKDTAQTLAWLEANGWHGKR